MKADMGWNLCMRLAGLWVCFASEHVMVAGDEHAYHRDAQNKLSWQNRT